MSGTKRKSPVTRSRPHQHVLRKFGDEVVSGSLACPTAVAVEALRTGVLALHNHRRRDGITREAEAISVDDIGRACGVQEEDSGVLRISAELFARRDHHRMELQPHTHP